MTATTEPDSTDETTMGPMDLPGFAPEPPPPGPDPIPPGATISQGTPGQENPTAGPSLDDVEAGAGDATGWSTSTTTPASGPSRASTHDPLVFAEIAHTIVGAVSLLIRSIRQRRLGPERPLPPGAWVADEMDQAAIGDPLARIAARHAPVGGKGSEDVVDGMAALVATAGYGIRGLELEANAPWAGTIEADVVDDQGGPQ